MMMAPGPRKAALTAHVVSSIGWFGAVAAFLALAVVGLTSQADQMVRAAYLATELITRFAIVPLPLVSLLSGVISSLGTKWGLFRYYWVVLKLIITTGATYVLLVHTTPIERLARAAASPTAFPAALRGSQVQMVIAPAATLVVLVVLTALSVYKPRGLTPYGQRKQEEQLNSADVIEAAIE